MTKREAIKTILSGHTIHIVYGCDLFDCDLNEEADDIYIEALKKVRDFEDRKAKELENDRKRDV